MGALRRLLSITLLIALFAPLWAAAAVARGDDESQLPACCRRNGAHHCAMNEAAMRALLAQGERTPSWRAPVMPCPFRPVIVVPHHSGVAWLLPAWSIVPGGWTTALEASAREPWLPSARVRDAASRGPPMVSPSLL